MDTPLSKEQQNNWAEIRRAARAVAQAGDLIADASRILDRFCNPADQDNWDRAFAWKLNELKQTVGICREVEQHLTTCAHQAVSGQQQVGN